MPYLADVLLKGASVWSGKLQVGGRKGEQHFRSFNITSDGLINFINLFRV